MHAKIKLEINDKSHKRKINYNLKKIKEITQKVVEMNNYSNY